MMIIFVFGMGTAAILASLAQSPMQLACALALLGCFASIYHPVGIPMLMQGAKRPGWTIGVNGMAGNLGIALAAVVAGYLVKHVGWRPAFALPGMVSILCGIAFAVAAKSESTPPAKRAATPSGLPRGLLSRVFLGMTLAATSGSLLFKFSTNGNHELLHVRFAAITRDPAMLGLLLAAVYAVASLAQLVAGRLLDRFPLKRLYLIVLAMQIPFLALAAHAESWWLYVLQGLFMVALFGAIPFTDAMIALRRRSHAFTCRWNAAGSIVGASSLAVWLLGPHWSSKRGSACCFG
nr:MFS transporter [Noviherbaspirillum aerium]